MLSYQAIIMGKTQNKLTFRCENTIMPITPHLEMLGIDIDDQLKFKIFRKVSQQVFRKKGIQKSVTTGSSAQTHEKKC